MPTPKKPKFLFHGSPNSEKDELVPRVSYGSGEMYGAKVYATDDPAIALIFTAHVDVPWTAAKVGDVPYAIIPLSREDFLKNDKGGFLYVLSPETFQSDSIGGGMGRNEWASSVAVKPREIIRIESSLSAMLQHGVQVYFVTKDQYEKMCTSGEPKWKLLKNVKSENERTGINIQKLGDKTLDND